MKRPFKIIIIALAALTLLSILGVFIINFRVKRSAGKRIVSAEEAAKLEDIDCVIVPGCLVHSDNTLSGMLADRLRRGVELYDAGAAPKLLEIAGQDGRFVPAEGEISDGMLRIYSEKIPRPVSARYAWTDWSEEANLTGENGLPAEPFWI